MDDNYAEYLRIKMERATEIVDSHYKNDLTSAMIWLSYQKHMFKIQHSVFKFTARRYAMQHLEFLMKLLNKEQKQTVDKSFKQTTHVSTT
jgi:hypothetical protein